MSEFIKEFGKDNFIMMLVIVGIIALILIIILIVEKKNANKVIKKELTNIKNSVKKESNVRQTQIQVKKSEEPQEQIQEEPQEVPDEVEHLDPVKPRISQEVYYASNDTTPEEAKEKLEEVTKRLIDEEENNIIDHTAFETEQEEKSIISYEELVKASHDIDQKNDKLLEDETEAAITIEELYKKHQEEQSILDGIDAVNEKVRVTNPVFEDEPKKFRNSEVISPVFGVYSGKLKPKTALKEIDKTVEQKDLEEEIQRTEDFLSELKKLKNKLD